ncbi:MAG: vWA domain-containing protein, partial [Polyangia bacterium]
MSGAIHLNNLTFEAPRWLWLLAVCVPVVWLVAVRWPVGARGDRRWLAGLVRTVVLAGLVVAAARPVRLTDDAAVSVVALVDVSASVSDAELERARALVRDLVREGAPPHEVRLVAFAKAPAELKIAAGPGGGRADMRAAALHAADGLKRPAGAEALGTDIGRALAFGAAVADPARTRRLLLLSDGRATGGDALAQAARLGGLGIRVDYVQLASGADVSAGLADVAIDGIEAPTASVSPHATFPLRIHLVADRPTRVRLRLTRDGRAMDPRDATRIL